MFLSTFWKSAPWLTKVSTVLFVVAGVQMGYLAVAPVPYRVMGVVPAELASESAVAVQVTVTDTANTLKVPIIKVVNSVPVVGGKFDATVTPDWFSAPASGSVSVCISRVGQPCTTSTAARPQPSCESLSATQGAGHWLEFIKAGEQTLDFSNACEKAVVKENLGVVGAKGDKGDQGVVGVSGREGAVGQVGTQGIGGVAGVAGTVGTRGETGQVGAVGVQGLIGVPGNAGVQGSPGVLSITSDQNITGSLTGQNLTLGWSGVLGVARGGTGLTSTIPGGLVVGDTANTLTQLPVGAPNQVLTVVGGMPTWLNPISGFADPLTTAGDLNYRDSTNTTTRLPIGTSGQVLTVGAGTLSYQTPTAFPISSVFGRTGVVTSAFGDYNTTQVGEGANLYYTNARADSRLTTLFPGLFDTRLAAKSTTNLAEGTNLYFTNTRADTRINALFPAAFNTLLAAKTTDNLVEGSTNKYYANSLFNIDFNTKTTADLAEGTNLYYTGTRFNSAFAAKSTDDLTQGITSKYYATSLFNTDFGSKTTDDLTEGALNLYYTNARADSRLTTLFPGLFDTRLAAKSTTNLAEGTNLYFTNTRADTRINALFPAAFNTLLAAKTTDNLVEGSSNLYFTPSRFTTQFIAKTTDDLTEGALNLYYTNARADSRLTTLFPGLFDTRLAAKSTTNLAEGTNLYFTNTRADTRINALFPAAFNTLLAAKTTDNLVEGSSNLYFTPSRFTTQFIAKTTDDLTQGSTNQYYATSLFNTDFGSKTSDNLTEGASNLYYSNPRARSALSAGVGIVYNPTTGVISTTALTTTQVTEGTNLYYTQGRFDTAFAAKSTTNLPEGVSLYFSEPRVLNTVLTGFVPIAGTVNATDSLLQAIDKLQGTNTTQNTSLATLAGASHPGLTLTGSNGLTLNIATQVLSLGLSSLTTTGSLSASDFSNFAAKQDALGFVPEDVANKSTLTTLGTSNTLYPTQNAVKTYVDNLSLGLVWQQPVEIINVIADTSTPVLSPTNLDVYILKSGANTGPWAAFNPGDMIQYQTNQWVFIKALTIGDRFGVSFKSATLGSGAMTGKDNNVGVVNGGSAGAFSYIFTAPSNNFALYVSNTNAYFSNTSFVYSASLVQWVQLSASTSLVFGNGFAIMGNNIKLGALTADWDQTGLFDIKTAGNISINGGNLTTTAPTANLFNTIATTVNLGGAANILNLGSAAGSSIVGNGALTLNSAPGTSLTLDSGTSGTVLLGTANTSKTIAIGTGTGGNTLSIATDNTTADTIAIGSSLDNFSLTSSGISISNTGRISNLAVAQFNGGLITPGCALGDYAIFADNTAGMLKKCQNGVLSNLNDLAHPALTLTGTNGLALNIATQMLSLGLASNSTTGALSAADWATFAAKENALTFTGNGLFSRTGNTVSGASCGISGQVLTWNGINWACITPPAAPVTSVFGRTGVITSQNGDYTTDQVTEGLANLYYTQARTDSRVNTLFPSLFDTRFSIKTTSNLAEGTNKYYTDTRARNAFSVIGLPLNYNATTGVFGIDQANTITAGYLTAADFNTFSTKQSALTFGNTTTSTTGLSITNGAASTVGPNVTVDYSLTAGIANLAVGAQGVLSGTSTSNTYVGADGLLHTLPNAAPAGWLTLGNTGTNPSTNFLGTMDNQPLAIRSNNTEVARFNSATGQDLNFFNSTTATISANKELVLRQNGDQFGDSILRLRNRFAESGAILETAGVPFVDFIFKTSAGQRNIRFESSGSGSSFISPNEFEFGVAGNPNFVAADNGAIFRKGNVGIGMNGISQLPQNRLEITQGTTDNSGLRFTNLTASSPSVSGNGKVLGLNATGDVVYLTDAGANIVPSAVTAGSSKISLAGTPATAALQPFSVDVNEANLSLANLGGLLNLSSQTSGILPVTRGGTSLGAAPANGQLLIGNGSAYTLGNLSGTNSIIGDGTTSPFNLVGDVLSPAPSSYYGTDGGGVKGFWSVINAVLANNGLTNTGGSIQLGGQLVQPTTIDGQANPLTLTNNSLLQLQGDGVEIGGNSNSFTVGLGPQVATGSNNIFNDAFEFVTGYNNILQGNHTYITGVNNNFGNLPTANNGLFVLGVENVTSTGNRADNTFVIGAANNISTNGDTSENIIIGFKNNIQGQNNAWIFGRDNVVKDAPSASNYIIGNQNLGYGVNTFTIGQNITTGTDNTLEFGFGDSQKVSLDNTGVFTLRGALSAGGNVGASNDVLVSTAGGVNTWTSVDNLLSAGAGISIVGNTITNTGARTVDNGLTAASNNIRLGGTLVQATTIAKNGFDVLFSGAGRFGINSASSNAVFNVANATSVQSGGAGNFGSTIDTVLTTGFTGVSNNVGITAAGSATGTITGLTSTVNGTAGGTGLTDLVGIDVRVATNGAALSGSALGIQVGTPGGSGIPQVVGINIRDQTGSSNAANLMLGPNAIPTGFGNWSIYNVSTKANYMGGNSAFGGGGTAFIPTSVIDFNGSLTARGLASAPVSAATTGRIYFDSGLSKFRCSENNVAYADCFGGPTALSNLTAATATNSISNANFAQAWNWSLTGPTNGLNLGESTASTGTGYVLNVGTIAASTAKPFRVSALANTIIDTTSTGAFTLGNTTLNTPITLQTGTGSLSLGVDAFAKTITIGNTTGATGIIQNVGTGNFSLNGVGASTYSFGAATTTGTFSIGGTAQTGTTTLFSSTGANIINFGSGTGATALSIGNNNTGSLSIGTTANAKTIAIGNTAGGTSLGLSAGTGALTLTGSTIWQTPASIGNLPGGGSIGSPLSTVDVGSSFTINQTTAGQTIAIPSATTSVIGRTVYISNSGTAAFNLLGTPLSAGASRQAIWNGTVWSAVGDGSSGVTAPLSSITAATASNTIDNLNFAQNWNWSTANSQNLISMTANALTTGSFIALNSTGTLTSGAININLTGGTGILSNTPGNDLTTPAGNDLNVVSGTTGNANFDSGTTGAVNLGTNANAKIITIGNTSGASGVAINNGTGAINIGAATNTGAINIGTGAAARVLTIGNATGATSLNINSGTGLQLFTSLATTTNAFNFTANSITSGNGMIISATSATRTGLALNILANGSNAESISITDSTNTCTGNPGATFTWTCSSDARLKKNITDSAPVLLSLNTLKIRQYDWISDGTRASYGVVAQEVEVGPLSDLVVTRADGIKAVRQVDNWMLVKGLQEVSARIDALSSGTSSDPILLAGIQAKITRIEQDIADLKIENVRVRQENTALKNRMQIVEERLEKLEQLSAQSSSVAK